MHIIGGCAAMCFGRINPIRVDNISLECHLHSYKKYEWRWTTRREWIKSDFLQLFVKSPMKNGSALGCSLTHLQRRWQANILFFRSDGDTFETMPAKISKIAIKRYPKLGFVGHNIDFIFNTFTMFLHSIALCLCLQISINGQQLPPIGNKIVNDVVGQVKENSEALTQEDITAITTKATDLTNEALEAGSETAQALEDESEEVIAAVEESIAKQIFDDVLTNTKLGDVINEKVKKDPTSAPTVSPTSSPTSSPTENPTSSPTKIPTSSPTKSPTGAPTMSPTLSPTMNPTMYPTEAPQASIIEKVKDAVDNLLGLGEGGN